MKHYTELEIKYLIISGTQSPEFDEHRAGCFSCNELYNDILQFQELLTASPALLDSPSAEKGVVVRPVFVADQVSVPAKERIREAVVDYFRHRPYTATASSLGFAFILYFTIMLVIPKGDVNPSYYRFNTERSSLEIFNASDDMLWQISVNNAKDYELQEGTFRRYSSAIVDMNRDGANDVVTIIRTGPEINSPHMVKIFNHEKKLIRKYETLAPPDVVFRGTPYNKIFYPITVLPVNIRGEVNLFFLANNGRSPSILVRMDNKGNIVGRYWHFGQLGSLMEYDVDNDGKKEIIAIGLNDTPFPEITNGVVIVVDPEKIEGDMEASATTGFGHRVASCEKMYLQIPRSTVDTVCHTQAIPLRIEPAEKGISIVVRSTILNDQYFVCEYIFSPRLEIITVKGDDPSARIHDALKREGKISSEYNQGYLDNLGKNIQYWSGDRWVNQPVFIQSLRAVSQQ